MRYASCFSTRRQVVELGRDDVAGRIVPARKRLEMSLALLFHPRSKLASQGVSVEPVTKWPVGSMRGLCDSTIERLQSCSSQKLQKPSHDLRRILVAFCGIEMLDEPHAMLAKEAITSVVLDCS